MKLVFFFISFLSGIYLLSNCANIKPPTGGPRDTIPPILVESMPKNKSLNYQGNTVKLTYDEYLQIKDLKKQLIITPLLEDEYESKIKKYSVELIFPRPFPDSTTFTFNFQEAIQDITENNVTKDNVFAFSTGNYIDSISINGKVFDLFTNEPMEDYTVCLYPARDTLDIFNSKPTYLTRTNEDGLYLIENIKNGLYRLYAYEDKNSNLICDIPKEKFGFIADTLNLNHNMDSVRINAFYMDMRPLEIQREGPAGVYYEIKLNKNIIDYEIRVPDFQPPVYHNFGEDKRTIRVYNTFQKIDSIKYYFSAFDSLSQNIRDTLYIKFMETKRKKVDFTYSILPKDKENITDDFKGTITFNKPILSINADSIYFKYDSLTYQFVPSDSLHPLDRRKDIYTFEMDLFFSEYLLRLAQADTITETPKRERPSEGSAVTVPAKKKNELNLHLDRATFISVEQDTMPQVNNYYSFLRTENFGIIRGTVNSDQKSFTIQLLDKQGMKVQKEIHDEFDYNFYNVKPGNYLIRVIVDNNQNGIWDPGNVFKLKEPEDVYFFPEVISVRANWEITDINLEF
jgi:uncharacterized protein (DUF2141 family)